MRANNRRPASDNDFSRRSAFGKNSLKKNSRCEAALFSIVDDDESMREGLGSLLESIGFRVETFASTEEFVQCDHLGQIACLILDVHLPGMSGLELQRLLSFATYNFPIIFITGRGGDRMREYALKGGAVEFLYKPFTAQALLTAVHAALER